MASKERPKTATYSLRKKVLSTRSKLEKNEQVMKGLQEKFREAGWIAKNSTRFIFVDLHSAVMTEIKKDPSQYEVFGRMLAELGLKDILPTLDDEDIPEETDQSKNGPSVPPTDLQAATTISQSHDDQVVPTKPKPKRGSLSSNTSDSAITQDVPSPGSIKEVEFEECFTSDNSSKSQDRESSAIPDVGVKPEECTSNTVTNSDVVVVGQSSKNRRGSYNEIQQTLAEHEVKIRKLQEQVKSEKEDKEGLGQQYQALSEEIASLKKCMDDYKKHKESELNSYRQKIVELEKEKVEDKKEIESLKEKVARMEKKIEEDAWKKEREILLLTCKLREAEKINDKKEITIQKKENEILCLTFDIAKLQYEKEIRKLKSQIDTTQLQ